MERRSIAFWDGVKIRDLFKFSLKLYQFVVAIPVLSIVPWVVLKMLFEDVYCWTRIENEYIVLLLEVPTGITVIVSFGYIFVEN